MKRILGVFLFFISIMMVSVVVKLNVRPLYFLDGYTGQTTILTYVYQSNQLNVDDQWFKDFEQDVISGVLYMEDRTQYAIIPYSFSKISPDNDYHDLYHQKRHQTIDIDWKDKISRESLQFEVMNQMSLWVSIDSYSSEFAQTYHFGNGVYTIPVYNNHGEKITDFVFATSDIFGIGESWNDGITRFILQQFLFTEIVCSNQCEDRILLPLSWIGGLRLEEVGDLDHYYYPYNNHNLIFEANFAYAQ